MDEAKLEKGVVVAERFRLDHEIGRGGMGCVWLAHHTSLDIPFALKFIARQGPGDASDSARFTQEARAAARLRSPHVVQILDHGVWESIPYIAMEFLEGETLRERIHRQGRLPFGATSSIVGAVALARAEEIGLVHRDLKPDNIFLVKHGDLETVRVLDFGVAGGETSPSSRHRLARSSGRRIT